MVSIRPRGLRRIPPFEERASQYEEVRRVMKHTMNPIEIRAHLDSKFGSSVELATIKSRIAGTHSPYGRIYQLPREPIPELAYLIGANFGDTSRCKNWHHDYTIRLRVKDEDFAREFARAASVVLGKPCKVWFDKKRGLWQTDVLSMLLYNLVTKPLSDLKAIIIHCSDCVAAFVRGFFDAEGCANNQGLTASNGNLDLLRYIRNLMAMCFNIEVTGPNKRGPAPGTRVQIKGRWVRVNLQNYIIRLRNVSLSSFEKHVRFTIGRKREALRLLVESRG